MGPVDILEIEDLESCERTLCNAMGIKDGDPNTRVAIAAGAELVVPHWGQSDVFPVEGPVPVSALISVAKVLRIGGWIREGTGIAAFGL